MLNSGGQSEQPLFSQLSQGLAGLMIYSKSEQTDRGTGERWELSQLSLCLPYIFLFPHATFLSE